VRRDRPISESGFHSSPHGIAVSEVSKESEEEDEEEDDEERFDEDDG
jgi:hypothetical protein